MYFLVQHFFVGLEYSAIIVSLWVYLKDVLKTEYANFYYGIIPTMYHIDGLMFSTLVGRIIDKHRRIVPFSICY